MESSNLESASEVIQKVEIQVEISGVINSVMALAHQLAVEGGWWNDPRTGERIVRNPGEQIALMHSELSEGLEAERKGLMDEHLPHRTGLECELADLVIRVFDFAGGRKMDIGGAIAEKMAYNAKRADHKPENRIAEGGKKF